MTALSGCASAWLTWRAFWRCNRPRACRHAACDGRGMRWPLSASMSPRLVLRPARFAARSGALSLSLSLAALSTGAGGCSPGETAPPQIALAAPPAPGTCAAWVGQPVERSCVPRTAMADTPLVLEVEEQCGVCGTTAERCSVTLEGRTLTLSLDGKTCEPPPGVACRESCARKRVRCRVPALPEGRYVVRYGDLGGRVDSLDVVASRDAPTACMLEDSGG